MVPASAADEAAEQDWRSGDVVLENFAVVAVEVQHVKAAFVRRRDLGRFGANEEVVGQVPYFAGIAAAAAAAPAPYYAAVALAGLFGDPLLCLGAVEDLCRDALVSRSSRLLRTARTAGNTRQMLRAAS